MSSWHHFAFRLRETLRGRHRDEEMQEEFRLHLEMRIERNIASGLSPDEARSEALKAFGGLDQIKERARDERRARWLEGLARDFALGARLLRKHPAYAFTVAATLALCLAANITIYSVIDAVLLRPLPFPDNDRLVAIFNSYPGAGYPRGGPSITNYFERRHAVPALESVSLISDADTVIGESGTPEQVPIARITPEFFATLGIPLAAGRAFTESELDYGAAQVAIITDEFWKTHFQRDPAILGKTFLNDETPVTVVGILQPGFRYLSSKAIFFRPLAHDPADRGPAMRQSSAGHMIARLAPGATIDQALAQLALIDAREMADPADPMSGSLKGWGYHTVVSPLHADFVASVKPTLVLLQAGALVLLLIGIGNIGNVMLVRASARAKELSVRLALGATRLDICQALLAETTLLIVIGAAVGLVGAAIAIRLGNHFGFEQLPLGAGVRFDGRIAVGSGVVALAAGALVSVPILWLGLGGEFPASLHPDTRTGSAGPSTRRLRHTFITAQIALAFVLLCGATLLGLSLKRVLNEPKGFNPEHILTGEITLPWKHYPNSQAGRAAAERILAKVRSLPGVTGAAPNNSMPFTGRVAGTPVSIDPSSAPATQPMRAHHRAGVTPEFWSTMDISLLRGRLLEPADDVAKSTVCVIDQAIANRYWPGRDPLGQRISFGTTYSTEEAVTIVGVVGNVKQNDLGEAEDFGMIYLPFSKFSTAFFYLAVKTALPPESIAATVQKAILELDPGLPVNDVELLQTRVDRSVGTHRSPALLVGSYATIALLLAGIGLYGVMAFSVAQRTREFGIRLALGAPRGAILENVLREGVWLASVGLVVGVAISLAANRYLSALLHRINSRDPAAFVAVGIAVALVALVAALIPARRATRVDPIVALRTD